MKCRILLIGALRALMYHALLESRCALVVGSWHRVTWNVKVHVNEGVCVVARS